MQKLNINQLSREVNRFDNEPRFEPNRFINNQTKPKWKQTKS